MNRADVARLLTLAAAYDSRTIGDGDVAAWELALSGLDVERCKAAIVKHYQESTDRVMPAHIRRIARTTTGAPGVIPETGEAYCGTCKGIHRPIEPCTVLARPEGFKQLIAAAFRSVADALQPRAIEAAPLSEQETPVAKEPLTAIQKRCAQQSTTAPDPTTTAARCNTCGTAYLDYPDGWDAHLAVFGHKPPTNETRETPWPPSPTRPSNCQPPTPATP